MGFFTRWREEKQKRKVQEIVAKMTTLERHIWESFDHADRWLSMYETRVGAEAVASQNLLLKTAELLFVVEKNHLDRILDWESTKDSKDGSGRSLSKMRQVSVDGEVFALFAEKIKEIPSKIIALRVAINRIAGQPNQGATP